MNEADSPSAINFIRDRLPKVRRFDRLAGPVGASFVLCVPTEFDSTLVTAIGRFLPVKATQHAGQVPTTTHQRQRWLESL